MTRSSLAPVVVGAMLVFGAGSASRAPGPYEPREALATFRLPPGYRIELVAHEPQITDPVDLSFDADGRIYVAEMSDYPAPGADSIRSRIKLLEDRDGDGFYETSTVFAEDLPFVNGVMAWKKGVLVSKAPDIIYFEDTDGDHRADVRRVVLTGFAATNPQLRMSNLEYGIDNWIYGAYSRAGGARGYPEFNDHGRPLRFPDDPGRDSADIFPGTDFRFRPDEFLVEPAGGMSQFGNAFDARGNRFTVWNSKHLQHVVVPHRYAARNPALGLGNVMASVPDHGDAATIYPITENPLNLHESEIGHFTSATGISLYTGGLFRDEYRDAAFVAEPVHNLVHADLLRPAGATFVGRRAMEGREFLASTDSWFRPVNTTIGPDGALYIVDFYRKLVEHPAWIARADSQGIYTFAGVLQESDFTEGQDRGRIYRVVPDSYVRRTADRPRLGEARSADLVKHLAHSNLWWRTTAQRLLVDRRDRSAVRALRRLARGGPQTPEAVIHALWTLEGIGALDEALVLRGLGHEAPVVREQAVRLAEGRLSSPKVQETLIAMAQDPDERVRFQLALTLGDLPAERSFDPLRQIAVRHLHDPWFQTAVLTGTGESAVRWFEAVRLAEVSSAEALEGKQAFLRRTASVIGARQEGREIAALLNLIAKEGPDPWRVAALDGLAEGLPRGKLRRVRVPVEGQEDLLRLVDASESQVRMASLRVASRIDLHGAPALAGPTTRAAGILADTGASVEPRVHAVRVLALDPDPANLPLLERLLDTRQPTEVQTAATEALVEMDDTGATAALLRGWNTYASTIREVLERGFLATKARAVALLGAVEAGVVSPARISRTGRARLSGHADREIRRRALALLVDSTQDSREVVIRRYFDATWKTGDPGRGKAVFQLSCSACHEIGEIGKEVGPDLSSLTNRTRVDLMAQTLDPNDNIAPGYEAYMLETADGRNFTGVMAEESPTTVSLRSPGGVQQTFVRSTITRLQPLPVSLMPEGLEQGITVQEMTDLLSYLKSLR